MVDVEPGIYTANLNDGTELTFVIEKDPTSFSKASLVGGGAVFFATSLEGWGAVDFDSLLTEDSFETMMMFYEDILQKIS